MTALIRDRLQKVRALLDAKQLDKAQRLLASLQPASDPEVLLLAGRYAYHQQDYATALQHLAQAAALKPDPWPELHVWTGRAHGKSGDNDQAYTHLGIAVEEVWDEAVIHYAYGRLAQDIGDMATAHKHMFRAWQMEPDNQKYATPLLFATMATPGMSDAHRAGLFRAWAAQVMDPLLPQDLKHSNTPDPERKLRVGYVSGDFRYHAAVNPVYPLLRFGNREQFEVFAYAQADSKDHLSELIAGFVDHWIEVQDLSDRELARRIRQDKIDILVDCSGHTQGNRLGAFALKPAPIQISAFGFIFTTGLKAMDYQFSDAVCTPPAREALYTERMIHLSSQIHWRPLTPELEALEVAPPPFEKNGYITFGSGNGTFKHNHEVVKLWGAILRHVPQSRLHFKHFLFGNERIQQAFRERFAKQGVDPQRLLFSGATKPVPHFQFYNEVDIALDPFPYTGGMTTCETLYMGVPLIALNGDGIRTSQALLAVAGVPELIASTPDEYGRKAVALARQPEMLKRYRTTLRDKLLASPIADTRAFVWEVEQAYRHVWRLWCQSQASS